MGPPAEFNILTTPRVFNRIRTFGHESAWRYEYGVRDFKWVAAFQMELFEVSALASQRMPPAQLVSSLLRIWVDGGFAGSIGCHAIDWANRNCSLGYWVDATHQDKGISTKYCASMLHYLFEELELQRAVIQCATGNTQSCAIFERLGFTREGVNREAELVGGRWLDLVYPRRRVARGLEASGRQG